MSDDKIAERFSENKRMQGKWFLPEIFQSFYWDCDKDIFYLIDEQDKYLIKLDSPELRILLNKLYMSRGGSEVINYLKDESKSNLKYFESIEEFDDYQKKMLNRENEIQNEDECELE